MKSSYQCRAIWISDIHLGTPMCKADALLSFLRTHEAPTLYLVGDIVDCWNVGPAWHWTQAQTKVVEEIARWHRSGVRVTFLPGNHDESNIDLVQTLFGSVGVRYELMHETGEGRRMLVIHGHQFDGSLNPNRWFPRKGRHHAYRPLLFLNQWTHAKGAARPDNGPTLLSKVTTRMRRAFEYMTDFRESAVSEGASQRGADGVICGHIHRAEKRQIGSILYVNDGDWVHSCTALIESLDGRLRLVQWDRSSETMIERCAEAAL